MEPKFVPNPIVPVPNLTVPPNMMLTFIAPVIFACFSNGPSQDCSTDWKQVSNSTFPWPLIQGQNMDDMVLKLENFPTLHLQCKSLEPTRWLGIQPLDSVTYHRGGSKYDPVKKEHTSEVQILLNSSFTPVLRCELVENTTFAAEIFLKKNDTQVPARSSRSLDTSKYFEVDDSSGKFKNGKSFVPCTSDDVTTQFKLSRFSSRSGPLHEASTNCAICTCIASSECPNKTFPCNSSQVCGTISESLWRQAGNKDADLQAHESCRLNYGCSTCTIHNRMQSVQNETAVDCNGDGIITCEDYARMHLLGKDNCTWDPLPPVFSQRLSECMLNQTGENYTIIPTEQYDPRQGFQIQGAIQGADFGFIYQCTSLSTSPTFTIPLSVGGKIRDVLDFAVNSTNGTNPIICDPSSTVHGLRLRFSPCKSIVECDLRYKSIPPLVTFMDSGDSATQKNYNNGTTDISSLELIPREDFGLIQCHSIFRPVHDNLTFGYIHDEKYLFTGLDDKKYMFTPEEKPPIEAVISIRMTSQGNTKLKMFECKISTFVLLPHVIFEYTAPGTNTTNQVKSWENIQGSTIESSKIDDDKLISSWRLTIYGMPENSTVTCSVPWASFSGWAKAENILAFDPVKYTDNAMSDDCAVSVRPLTTGLIVANHFYEFECRISTFFHYPYVQFYVIRGDQNISDLQPILDGTNTPDINVTKISQNNTGRVSWRLSIRIELNISAIVCQAPWTTSFGGMATARLPIDVKVSFPDNSTDIVPLIGVSVALSIILLMALLICILWRKYRMSMQEVRNLTKGEVDEFFTGDKNYDIMKESGPTDVCRIPFNQDKVICNSRLKMAANELLGKGEFGVVCKGKFDGKCVAVKTTKSNADVDFFKAFLLEIKVMAYIGDHPNIVQFFGAVVDKIEERVCFAVIEFSPHGNLLGYLQTNSLDYGAATEELQEVSVQCTEVSYENKIVLNESTLVSMCRQIASGLEFLAEKHVIHGDMATRNVLVFHDNVVKVTDFGLSKKLYNCANYVKTKQAPLPWRWMALESLRFFEFSTQSDVWSYGVTLWEIFSLGQVPFAGLSWTPEFADEIDAGQRLQKPKKAPQAVYDLMLRCWEKQPDKRPSFTEIKHFFGQLQGSLQEMNDPGYSNVTSC